VKPEKEKETMKSFQHSTLLLLSVLASLLPAAAQARTYQVIAADVPFKFAAGERTFRPGHYEFILVGTGLMAIRDFHQHVVASLVTRSSEEAKPSPSTRLVFDRSKKKARLEKMYLEGRAQVLEVVGEQLAMRSTPPPAPPLPVGLSFSQPTDGCRVSTARRVCY
jgi:hypothetical protein